MFKRFPERMMLWCICLLLTVGFLPSCSEDEATPAEPGIEYAWSEMTSGTTESLYGFWGTSSTNIYGCGEGETVIHWAGSSWSVIRTGNYMLRKVWGSSATDIFFVGNYPPPNREGYILHYDGTDWEVMDFPSNFGADNQNVLNVWGTASNNVYAVGGTYMPPEENNGFILHYDGSEWSLVHTEDDHWLIGIWGTSASYIYAVGVGGKILHYNGSNWSNVDQSATGQNLEAVMGSAANDVWAVGWLGTILHYNGTSWIKDTFPTDPQGPTTGQTLFNLYVFQADEIFAVGKDRSIIYYDGSGWRVMSYTLNSEELYGLWGASATDVWTAGQSGYMLHYGQR